VLDLWAGTQVTINPLTPLPVDQMWVGSADSVGQLKVVGGSIVQLPLPTAPNNVFEVAPSRVVDRNCMGVDVQQAIGRHLQRVANAVQCFGNTGLGQAPSSKLAAGKQ
jgi:hypothetical protein